MYYIKQYQEICVLEGENNINILFCYEYDFYKIKESIQENIDINRCVLNSNYKEL